MLQRPFFAFLLTLALPLNAAARAAPAKLHLEAENGITCTEETQQCVASKNVRFTHGRLRLQCDQLTALMRRNAQGGREIYCLKAQGNVRFSMPGGGKAAGGAATYHLDTHLLTLSGHPEVHQGPHIMAAARLEILLDPQRGIQKITSQGQSELDIAPPQVLKPSQKPVQTRALIDPHFFEESVKPRDQ